jgi:transcription elongation factor Elf1
LLADPQDGQNILFGFGYGQATSPRSIPAKTVFLRCVEVIPTFTQDEFKSAMSLMDLRNAEVHTGAAVFEDLPTHRWQAEFYRLLKILLDHLSIPLAEVLGNEDAPAAERMLAAARDDLIGGIAARIQAAAAQVQALSPEALAEKRSQIRRQSRRFVYNAKTVECPVCASEALLRGEHVRSTPPEAHEDGIRTVSTVLPTRYDCGVCELTLGSHDELYAAGRAREAFRELSGQFAVEEFADPLEFYGIEPQYDPDPGEYMND